MSSNLTAGSNNAPFDGSWETAFLGYTSSFAPVASVGSIDTEPFSFTTLALGVLPNGCNAGSCANAGAGPLVILVADPDSDIPSGTLFTITNSDSLSASYAIDDACAYLAQDNGADGETYQTFTWPSKLAGADFADGDITVVAVASPNAPVITGSAVGNGGDNGGGSGGPGTDVLLTWTLANCSDATFAIYQDGSLIETVSAPSPGYVISDLSPDTTYEFYVVGNVNGQSGVVSVTTGCPSDAFNCDCAIEPVYQTLAELRTRMMIRLGYPNQSASPPPGMAALIDAFLYDAQKLIWKQLSRAGLNLERFFRWIMVPGQRYYGINDNAGSCTLKLDPYKVVWAGFEDLNQAWYRLTEGVPPEYYTRANINFGWPTHYEIRSCIEIFPAPQAPYTLWIKGDFGLASFVEDADTATIDDEAIFMLALGNAKAHYGQRDAQSVLAQADTYIRGLVAGLHGTRRYVPRTRIQNPATPPRFLPLGDAQA